MFNGTAKWFSAAARRSAFSTHGFFLSILVLLSFVLTWPLLPRIFTHVPGLAQWAFDESTFV